MKCKVLLLIGIFLTLGLTLFAGTIEHLYHFDAPKIYPYDDYHKIEMNGLMSISKPGEPELPSKSVQLLLPPGEQAVSITVIYKGKNDLSGEYNIYPKQRPYPISYQGKIEFTEPDPEIYNSNKTFPEKLHTEVQTQYLRGHSIAILNIFPVQYIPVSGKVSYFSEMKVIVETEPTAEAENSFNSFYRADEITKARVRNIVHNPKQIDIYPAESKIKNGNNKYVIITNSTYSSSFNSFAEFKTKQGYNVLIKTVENIYSEPSYNGVDNQDEIRNFIKYAYQNFGTEYVLIGGDVEIVPHRGFWVNAGGTEDYDIPADLYYAALDRVGSGTGPDWNVDNDSKWGETSEADYFAEVYIGRISADIGTEFSSALNKQTMYQQSPVVSDLEKAIMVGEQLNSSPLTWGGTYKDEIKDGSSNNGYTTTGFPGNFTVQTQYERDGSWSWTDLRNKMNAGTNILNHLGHSNPDYNMKFYRSYVTNTNLTSNGTNHNFYIIYTQGCYPASFDNRWDDGSYDSEDCIAEKFTTISNGCVAFIGNSRYGWYNPGGTNSGSQYLDRQFFDALFGENIYKLGEMNDDSKEDGASQCNGDPWFRWSYYCVNLFGDPSIDVWTDSPGTLSPSYASSINVTDTQLSVSVGVSGALVGLSQNGNHIGSGITDASGNVTVTFDNSPSVGTMDIYITAHNYNIHTGTIDVISNQPNVIYYSHQINDSAGNNNGQADYGESILLDVTLENNGDQTAYNVNAVLSTSDSYITITDDSQSYGTILAGNTSTQTDAFAFNIDNDIPDQHQVNLNLEITGTGEYTWYSSFYIIVNAPHFSIGDMTIDDSGGDGDGRLDPGETVDLIIPTTNDGHSDSPTATGTLNCTNSYITINDSTHNFGVIHSSATENAVFNITVSPSTPIGESVTFDYDVTAGSYNAQDSFTEIVGLDIEDFETGDFSSYSWTHGGDADWTVVTEDPYEGTYCAKSGDITNSQTSELSVTLDVSAGDITFYRKVSSESSYDYLRFYIDGSQKGEWSGEVSWSEVSYSVSAGTRTFKWAYEKDGSVSSGSDCAWIDYIVFPPYTPPDYGTIEGTVSEYTTKAPIQDAVVTIAGKSDTTDATGYYLIENVIVDIFHVEGGELHDFIYHNYGETFRYDPNLHVGTEPFDTPDYILGGTETYEWTMTNSSVTAQWGLAGVSDSTYPGRRRDATMTLTLLPAPDTRIFHLQTQPYEQEKTLTHTFMARRKGPVNTFVAVYESTFNQPTLVNAAVEKLPCGIAVTLSFKSNTIVILCRSKPGRMVYHEFSTDGVYALFEYPDGKREPTLAVLGSGMHIESKGFRAVAASTTTLAMLRDREGKPDFIRSGSVQYVTFAEGNRYPDLEPLSFSVCIGAGPERQLTFPAPSSGAK